MSQSVSTTSERSADRANTGEDVESPDNQHSDVMELLTKSPPEQFEVAADSQLLSHIFGPIDVLADRCRLGISTEGLALRVADRDGVSLVDVWVDAGSFDSFAVEPGTLGLSADSIVDALGIAEANDTVRLALDPTESSLDVVVGEISRSTELHPPENLRQPLELPGVEFPATAHISQSDLSFALDAASYVDDRVTVDIDPSGLSFAADGDIDAMQYSREPNELVAFDPDDVTSMFDSTRLRKATKALPSGEVREVRAGNDVPIIVRTTFPNAEGLCQYLIAPKLSE
jgi:proliferating cell nuclear antigen